MNKNSNRGSVTFLQNLCKWAVHAYTFSWNLRSALHLCPSVLLLHHPPTPTTQTIPDKSLINGINDAWLPRGPPVAACSTTVNRQNVSWMPAHTHTCCLCPSPIHSHTNTGAGAHTHPNKDKQTQARHPHMHTQALSVRASARHVWGYGMINRTPYRWPHWGEEESCPLFSERWYRSLLLSCVALSPHRSLLTLTTLSLSYGRFMSGFQRLTVLARCQHDPH